MTNSKFFVVARHFALAVIIGCLPAAASAQKFLDVPITVKNCTDRDLTVTTFNAWDSQYQEPVQTVHIGGGGTSVASCSSQASQMGPSYNACGVQVACGADESCKLERILETGSYVYQFVNDAPIIESGTCSVQSIY